MVISELERHLADLTHVVFDNTVVIAVISLSLWLLTTLGLKLVRHRDPRTGYLADFFGVPIERVIPLPPSTALWNDFYRTNSEAVADSHFPQGSPSLQGAYLIHAHGGMTLVAIHNLDVVDLYRDPEEPELVDYIQPSIGVHGRLEPHRLPFDIEDDAARRAHIIEFFLKARYGYPGKVRVITLLRDKDRTAPEPDTLFTYSGETIHRLTFDDQEAAQKTLRFDDRPVDAQSLPSIRRWFLSYPGRQTPRFRLIWRTTLLVLCAIILWSGYTGITSEALQEMKNALLP